MLKHPEWTSKVSDKNCRVLGIRLFLFHLSVANTYETEAETETDEFPNHELSEISESKDSDLVFIMGNMAYSFGDKCLPFCTVTQNIIFSHTATENFN